MHNDIFAIFSVGPLAFLISKEGCGWPTFVDEKWGFAVTYWKRTKWCYGIRFSLLLGAKRPFMRITSYSCPSIGTEGIVKPLDCVKLPWSNYNAQ